MVPLAEAVVAIARQASTPNTGWAAMCERAGEAVGDAALEALRGVDLADDALDLRGILVELRRSRPIPRRADTLAFELFERRRREVVLSVRGLRGFGPGAMEAWRPESGEVVLEGLAAIRRAAAAARAKKVKEAIGRALLVGAAALVARFASEDLRQRVVAGFRDGELVEIAPPRSARGRVR